MLINKVVWHLVGSANYLRKLQWLTIRKLLGDSTNEDVLDLGAGSLQYTIDLARQGSNNVFGVDLIIRKDKVYTAMNNGVILIQADATNLPFQEKTFDKILMSSLLHMVPDPVLLLKECGRIIKSDGRLVVSVPNNYQFIPKMMRFLGKESGEELGEGNNSYGALINQLNEKFGVKGPRGYYSYDQLNSLLRQGGFEIREHFYAPNRYSSFFWEIAVLLYNRFGNIGFHVLFLLYPLGYLLEIFCRASEGSEHIILARVVNNEQ